MFIRISAVAKLGTILLGAVLAHACSAQLVQYDNFTSHRINPDKWIGLQNYDPDIREAFRGASDFP